MTLIVIQVKHTLLVDILLYSHQYPVTHAFSTFHFLAIEMTCHTHTRFSSNGYHFNIK